MLFHKKVVILQPQVENSSCRWNSLAPAFAAFWLSALRTMAAMRALGWLSQWQQWSRECQGEQRGCPQQYYSETRNEPSPLGKHIERWRRDS